MVGVMVGGKGSQGFWIFFPTPGWECAVGVGTPGSYFWFGDQLPGMTVCCREDGNSCGVSHP